MAKFTQDVRPTNDPSYIGLSKEPDRLHPNKGLGVLFEGIGEGITGITTAADNYQQDQIGQQVRAENDQALLKEGGLQAAIEAGGGLFGDTSGKREVISGEERYPLTQLNRPPNAEVIDKQMSRLRDAYQQGAIGDMAYLNRLDSFSRQLRSRYPGYGDVIDQKFQSITGVIPANALRREMEQQLSKQMTAANSKQDKDLKYLLDNQADLPPGIWEKVSRGEKVDMLQIYDYVGRQQRYKKEIDTEKNELALRKARNEETGELGQQVATKTVNGIVNKLITDTSNGVNLEQQISGILKSGKTPTPEEQTQIEAKLNFIESQMRLQIETQLNALDRSGNSIKTYINDPTKVNNIVENAMSRFKAIRQAVSTGDIAMIGAAAREAKAMQDYQTRDLIKNPIIARMAAAKDRLGPEFLGVITQRSDKLKEVTQALLENHSTNRAMGTGEGLTEDLKTLKQANEPGGKKYQIALDNVVRDITRGNLQGEGLKNYLNSIFGPNESNVLTNFDDKSRLPAFLRLANPEIAKKVNELGDPEVKQNYQNWLSSSLNTVFRTGLSGISKEATAQGNWQLSFDPKTFRFIPEVTKAGDALRAEGPNRMTFSAADGSPNFRAYMGEQYQVLEDLNKGLTTWAASQKAVGKDPTRELQQFLTNFNFQAKGPEKTLLQKMFEGLGGSDGAAKTDAQSLGSERYKEQQKATTPGKQSSLINIDSVDPVLASYVDGGDAVHMAEAVNRGQDPVTVAMRYIDVDESEGRDVLRTVFRQALGKSVDPEETPWCAAFVNAVVQSTGTRGTGSLAARSFLNYGTPTDKPSKGDIVVFSRGSDPNKGHVGFFMGYDDNGDIRVLGGNQGNKVSVQTYPASRFLGARKIPKAEQMAAILQGSGDTQTA